MFRTRLLYNARFTVMVLHISGMSLVHPFILLIFMSTFLCTCYYDTFGILIYQIGYLKQLTDTATRRIGFGLGDEHEQWSSRARSSRLAPPLFIHMQTTSFGSMSTRYSTASIPDVQMGIRWRQ